MGKKKRHSEKKPNLTTELDNDAFYKEGDKRRNIEPKKSLKLIAKTESQKELLKSIDNNLITIAVGSAGSGKTLLSVNRCLHYFIRGDYDKIIFTRPCIEANGENLGFLPGDLNEKISPYMMPIFDFMSDYLDQKQIESLIKDGSIRTLPLAYMRGCTFSNSFVILDECLTGEALIEGVVIENKRYKRVKLKSLIDNFKNNKNIKVLSYNEKNKDIEDKKVINIFENGEKQCLKIYLNNNRKTPLITTENHPFAIFKDGKIIWKEAIYLKEGDKIIRNCQNKNNSLLLDNEYYDILLGILLGDGSLSRNISKQNSYRIRKTHGLKQYEYMQFCMNMFNGKEKMDLISGYTKKPLCGFDSKSLEIDKDFINSLYKYNKKTISKNIKKYFTDRTLSLFYMDDGSIHINTNKEGFDGISFHTQGFNYQENLVLKEIMDEKY
jgi:hypothetical protein